MSATIRRAIEIAHSYKTGAVWVDSTLAAKKTALCRELSSTVAIQTDTLACIEFALKYYSEPELYQTPGALTVTILDDGLRARTALALLKPAFQQARQNHHSYGE